MSKKPDKLSLLEYTKNHSALEAGLKFDVTRRTIQRWLCEYDLPYYERKYGNFSKELNNHQKNVNIK